MQNDNLVSQLRLAADLLETGHPWEYCNVHYNPRWAKEHRPENSPLYRVANGFEIRPILATPPDGRPLHNPDNLNAEQVGIGFRLMLLGEKTNVHVDCQQKWKDGKWTYSGAIFSEAINSAHSAYRLPLSVPWPEAKPDPYAKAEKKTVPLGPEDVRCGDELDIEGKRFAILSVSTVGVEYWSHEYWSHGIHQLTFKWLESNKIKIRRKNSNEWHLCNKLE